MVSGGTAMGDSRPFSDDEKPLTAPPSSAEEARHVEALRVLCRLDFEVRLSDNWEDQVAYER